MVKPRLLPLLLLGCSSAALSQTQEPAAPSSALPQYTPLAIPASVAMASAVSAMPDYTPLVVPLAAMQGGGSSLFPKPSDVAPYVPVEPTYAAGTADNVLNTTEVTGVGLPDIPTPNAAAWTITGTFGDSNGFKAIPPGSEKKFRTHAEPVGVLSDDAIRNWCQPGAAHPHVFFGTIANACSTFATLRRDQQKSAAGGGALNGTSYWVPLTIIHDAWGDGRTYGALFDYATIYYAEDPSRPTIRVPLGMRYVPGFHMDLGDAWLQSKINAANAQPGTAGRYQLTNGSVKGGGYAKLVCQSTGQKVDSFATAAGGDPFSPTCPSSSKLDIEFKGAGCWDRTNNWSPGGYSHVIPRIWDNVKSKWTCPQNWGPIAELQVKFTYTHEGASGPRGYTKWRLSSDPIAKGAYTGTINGQTVLPMQTFHADWFGAWDGTVFNLWQDNCLGANSTTPHECDNGVFAPDKQLLTTTVGPSGRSPQVSFSNVRGTSSRAKMIPLGDVGGGHEIHAVANNLKLVAQGDSLQIDATGGPERYRANNGTVTVVNRAASGAFLSTVTAQQATVIADKAKVVTIGVGTNDLPTANITVWLATYDSYVANLRAAGSKVAPILIPPKNHPSDQAGFNAARATANAHLKAGVGTRYDAVIDYGQSTCFDQDSDAQGTACYSDGVHPNATGYAAMVPIYDDVIDSLLGM